MEKEEKNKFRFGLLGRDIDYSFSRGYFIDKFLKLGLKNHSYENFDIQEIDGFKELLEQHKNIKGLNVTIPYKEAVLPYLDELDPQAQKIGAVNTIKFTPAGLIGFNTDAYGFRKSLEPHLKKHHKKALILGTGGASKAIAYVLDVIGIDFSLVSRNPKKGQLSYTDLTPRILEEYLVIINCTPLGTHPDVEKKPNIPYENIGSGHLLFDLIYNPEKTAFLKEGELRDASICNGLPMLELQAEKAWEIWNNSE
jgi:shikimate dehydrogenase